MAASLGEEVLGQPSVRLLREVGLVLHPVGEGQRLPGSLHLLKELGSVEAGVHRVSPGSVVDLPGRVVADPVELGVLPPRRAAHHHPPARRRQHRREHVLKDRLVVLEERRLVEDDEVRRVATEEVLTIWQSDYPAPVPEVRYRPQPPPEERRPDPPRRPIDQSLNNVVQDHALPAARRHDQGRGRGVGDGEPDGVGSQAKGLPRLSRPTNNDPVAA